MKWPCVRACAGACMWVCEQIAPPPPPPRAGEQAAAQEARALSPATHSDSQGLNLQAGGTHQCVLFSQEEQIFSMEHIQTVSFFYNKL